MSKASSSSTMMNSEGPPSLLHHTMITAPLKVVYNTFYFTTAGVLTGATLGVYRSIPAMPTAFKTGLNTGIFSFTFFSIREYALHPLISLTFPSIRPFPRSPLTPPSRTDNLLSTALAGTITGSLFTYFSRGPKGSIRGGITLGIACTFVQGLINELELTRIKVLSVNEERKEILKELDAAELKASTTPLEVPPTYTRSIDSPTPNVPSRETFSERSDRLIGSSFNSFKRGLERISPVRKMKDGDYEKALGVRLEGIEKELGEVQGELEDLRKE